MITNPQNTKIKKTKSVPPVPFQNRGHLQSETESSESGESSDSTESIFAKFAQFAVSYSIFAKSLNSPLVIPSLPNSPNSPLVIPSLPNSPNSPFGISPFLIIYGPFTVICVRKLHAQPNYALCID